MRHLPTHPAGFARQLQAAAGLLTLVNIPGAGRGLVAAADIPQGTVVHEEFPMLATPAAGSADCQTCLAPLPSGGGAAQGRDADASAGFCSAPCAAAAQREWAAVERRSDLSALCAACAESGEKLPLLAARLACMQLQRGGHSAHSGDEPRPPPGSMPRGDALQGLDHLCFAKVPQPPEEWVAMHGLLVSGLQPGGAPLGELTLQWYCWVLSRLHINVFRVDTIPTPDLLLDRGAMLRSMAGGRASAGRPPRRSGTAAYLLASMFNHSCEPNVDVTFPQNNAAAAFVAATSIARGTELCISYVDAGLERAARQAQLRFAYGFTCGCVRCQEEGE